MTDRETPTRDESQTATTFTSEDPEGVAPTFGNDE